MSEAYIIFPDIVLDALDKNNNSEHSKLFLDKLLKEKERVCTLESKRYVGFMADYHLKGVMDIILDILNSEDKVITDEEINLMQLTLSSCYKDGIEDYAYQDNFTPLLDLAKDKSDTFDVFLVCNNPVIKRKIKEKMNSQRHFGDYVIFDAKEALFRT